MNPVLERLKNIRLVRNLYYKMRGIFSGSRLRAAASKTVDSFGLEVNDKERVALIGDMVKTYADHGFDFSEYLCYHFQDKTEDERCEFVADWEHLGYTCTLNDSSNDEWFDNKWFTYTKYGKFYKRGIAFCEGKQGKDEFISLVVGKDRIIVKPLNASCGRGVKIVEIPQESEKQNELYDALASEYNGSFVAEEVIVQVPEMAKFHPNSVNTVRVPTIRMDDEVRVIHPFMRIGQHGNCVDNAGAGGIICEVDVETGELLATGDEMGKRFTDHPNTGEKIIGFVIPEWESAKALVRELAMVLPSNRYTGWDLALTENGWVLVEANRRGQFVWQIASQTGFRREINQILKQLKKKY